ncbi:uncharacterized protein OCT59_001259 [Rhizophagus irregularis]|nr:hypothetical protein OCT59_001259 [Rhizophagus irregularis]GBC29820.1 hypothetical protein GLOIN_2v1784405 [Rhizophagus irregularis DAOM 181602=DAOM 197198]CAB4373746.1 unnamed protein product [Rhizophagus irregularis]CAB5358020.1 unnamed protein product [Rhizophagus irregularis]
MTCQLPSDCLNEIFECLEEDTLTLHSCLLTNRLWCGISVRILWRNIWDFNKSSYQQNPFRIDSSILSILYACLPNESKELLQKNGIFISTPTAKKPLFNYVAFCRVLSVRDICRIVDNAFKHKPPHNSLSLEDRNYLVINEIIKMFEKQIYSLKKLFYYNNHYHINYSFPYFPGIRNLSELHCSSNLPSNFFYQLAQLCHNIQTLSIDFHNYEALNELKEFISLQDNLKSLTLSAYDASWESILPSIKNHSNITRLHLYGDSDKLPFSFVSLLTNLQEFIFSFFNGSTFEEFNMFQHINFSKLHTLKIPYQCPKPEYVMKFLENNGKYLKKFHTDENDETLSLSIAKFCPNLRNLFVIFNSGETDILKTILLNCCQLESIKIWCGEGYLTENEVYETVADYAPPNFCELKLFNESYSDVVSPDELECFFITWKNRKLSKLITLIIIKDYYYGYNYLIDDKENMRIIEKYVNLGVAKYETIGYEEEDKEEYYYYY